MGSKKYRNESKIQFIVAEFIYLWDVKSIEMKARYNTPFITD